MNNKEVWFFIFACGTLFFNWPFLDMFDVTLPYYLFGLWALFIACVGIFIFATKTGKKRKGV